MAIDLLILVRDIRSSDQSNLGFRPLAKYISKRGPIDLWLQALRSLEVLDMHSNLLESLNGLSALTNLRRLNLAGNRISQLSSLSMLSCLEDLNLSRNFIINLKVQEASSGQEGEDAKVASLPNSLRKLNMAANRCAMYLVATLELDLTTRS